jgi:rubrerythrin
MKGGIDAWNGLVSRAEVDQGIYLIEGDEGPEEVISLAYGLEEGTHRFYRDLSERSTDGKTRDLFEKLSKAEIQHKENLWEHYMTLTGGGITREAFETDALDLYLRMAMKNRHEETKAIFYQLADEEKAHLRILGELLRRMLPGG